MKLNSKAAELYVQPRYCETILKVFSGQFLKLQQNGGMEFQDTREDTQISIKLWVLFISSVACSTSEPSLL